MEIGLFFGSFNPIHIGHMIIANLVRQNTTMREVWFVVTPQNPFKKNHNLLHEFDRYDMVRAAIGDDYQFRVSDIEFHLPKPNYTINTLVHLNERYPEHQFRLILGSDNLLQFPNWKNHEEILKNYGLIVYPRPNVKGDFINHPNIEHIDAPEMDISASFIRKMIQEKKSIKYLLPDAVVDMIRIKNFYS